LPRKTENCKPDPKYTPRVTPPVLIAQQGTPSLPSSDTLAEAVLWDYSFSCLLAGDAAFEITYNEDRAVAYTVALEDARGIAQIRVTAASGALPLVLMDGMTLVPIDGVYQYRRPEGSLLTYEDAAATRMRTVVIERLSAIDVQSARATVQGVTFPDPFIPFIENVQFIDIGGPPATIAAHLAAVLQTLLGTSPYATQPASIECRYGYTLGGLPIEAPVVLVRRQDLAIGFDDQLLEQIEASVRQWLDTVQPTSTGARLIFSLTLWSAVPRFDAPLLRLANVSVSMSDVVFG
jgi:hypothetical protein